MPVVGSRCSGASSRSATALAARPAETSPARSRRRMTARASALTRSGAIIESTPARTSATALPRGRSRRNSASTDASMQMALLLCIVGLRQRGQPHPPGQLLLPLPAELVEQLNGVDRRLHRLHRLPGLDACEPLPHGWRPEVPFDEVEHVLAHGPALLGRPGADRRVQLLRHVLDLDRTHAPTIDLHGRKLACCRHAGSMLFEIVDSLYPAGASSSGVSGVRASSRASMFGRTVTVAPARPSRTSRVFRPWPVTSATTRSPGRNAPAAASLAVIATVTPAAVSPNTPVVRASSRIASTTSSSATASTRPPVERTTSRTSVPSAGSPMPSDFTMPLGFTGVTSSRPAAKAVATGAQPSDWAPWTLNGTSSTRPCSASTLKPWCTLVSRAPEATGTTTWSGSDQPSCSATSSPTVLEPSAYQGRRLTLTKPQPNAWAAAAAAVAPARLPVEAHAMVVRPKARARAAATATTRSLKELVGLRVSSFSHSSPGIPSASARRGAGTSGVKPGARSPGNGRAGSSSA